MPDFTITRQIDAPVEKVWEVLHDFGDIQRWSPGVKTSELTSEGEVTEGATRRCDFAPFGSVNERIAHYTHEERMTVHIFEAFRLPISEAFADFNIAQNDGGTELILHYRYDLNWMGRLMRGYTDRQMRKGIGGLAKSLAVESERLAAV